MTVVELRKKLEQFGPGREVKIEEGEFGHWRDIKDICIAGDDDDEKVVIFYE